MIGAGQILLGGGGPPTLLSAIQRAGLTSGLTLCLDAGDAASYTSGQSWLDRSGGGYDFFLGADGSAGASDPTFTGSVGSPTAYWAFAGAQYFTYDSANETWMTNLHKDNALFTALIINYKNVSSPRHGTSGTGVTGISLALGSQSITVANATATVLNKAGDTTPADTTWHFCGISLNEAAGAGGSFFYLDGGYNQVAASNTFDGTYSSPSAGAATSTMQLAATGSANSPAANGTRISCIAFWSTALTKANMDTLWGLMRGRFSL